MALLYIAFALLLGRFVQIPFAVPGILRTIGFTLTVIGFLLGGGAFIEFKKARTTLDLHGSVKSLVISGVYGFTRNPIYLGFLLMVIGLPLNSGFYWGILVAPFYAVTMNRLVLSGKKPILRKIQRAVHRYRSRVRRWL